ncbi:MAG: FliM/FliN family flagellar motor switch protein [Planctomycetales bacterium]
MGAWTPAEMERVKAACGQNAPALAESFNLCFQTQHTFRIGDPLACVPNVLPEELSQPGLILSFELEGGALLALLPATLPLPEWHRQPDKSESSRLQTLPVEWSLNLFPEDLEVQASKTDLVESLAESLLSCGPVEGAILQPIFLGEEETAPSFFLLGPVERSFQPAVSAETTAPEAGTASSPEPIQPPAAERIPLTPEEAARRRDQLIRMRHILKLPVPVIVVLAEKKIELGQLMTLGPGAIVTFEKSCDDLLDLCVNNRPYCRGEAVKIGEKFGLKINSLTPGVVELRN